MGDTHELKPCPFCDGAPRIVEPHQSDRSIEGETDDEEWLSFIECDCVDMFFVKGSATSQDEARQSVVTAWNRRPALSAGQAQPGSIKPLEWRDHPIFGGDDLAVANIAQWGEHGHKYQVGRDADAPGYKAFLAPMHGSWFWTSPGHATLEAAKAAAQSDYEARIRSALSAPLPEIEGGDKGDGWRPIDTAPIGAKGTSWMMLAYGPEGDQSVSVGMKFHDKYYAASTFYVGGPHDSRQFRFQEHEVFPTHWKHLPAAPSASIEGETHV